jgi:hypothetical protein
MKNYYKKNKKFIQINQLDLFIHRHLKKNCVFLIFCIVYDAFRSYGISNRHFLFDLLNDNEIIVC